MSGKVAERWKIEAVLALVRAVAYERFVIAGLGNPQGKTRRFMQLVGFNSRQVHETDRLRFARFQLLRRSSFRRQRTPS